MKTENRNKIQKVFLTVANADIRPFHRDWLLTRILCEFKIKRLEVSKRVASTVNDSERRNRWNDSATGTSSSALSVTVAAPGTLQRALLREESRGPQSTPAVSSSRGRGDTGLDPGGAGPPSAPPLLLLRGGQHPAGRLRGGGCQADGRVTLKVKTHFKTGICYVIWKPMDGVSKARNALRTV